jgi:hypothetical protein
MSLRKGNRCLLREDPPAEDRAGANRALAVGRRAARAQEPSLSAGFRSRFHQSRLTARLVRDTAPKRRATLASLPRSPTRWWYRCGDSRAGPAGTHLPLPGADLRPIITVIERAFRLAAAPLRRESGEEPCRWVCGQ